MLRNVTGYFMAGYTPVFRAILQSTVWEEAPHVKVVWLTMLLMCDRNGFVESTIPGLARSAVVTREQCLDAIERLSSPDPDSKTSTKEGRRIVKVDDGWQLVNHQKYKDKVGLSSQAARERVRNHRARKKESRAKLEGENPGKATKNNIANPDTSDTCNAGNGFPIGIGLGFSSQISSQDQSSDQRVEPLEDVARPTEELHPVAPVALQPCHTRFGSSMRGHGPGRRPDVISLHKAWSVAVARPGAVLRAADGDDAYMLAGAIEAHGINDCLLVAKYATKDGMVNGTKDDKGSKHESIRYIFGNEETFSRILAMASQEENKKSSSNVATVLKNNLNAGRLLDD